MPLRKGMLVNMEKKNNKNKIIIGVVLVSIIIIGILVYKNINNTTSTSNWYKSKQEEKSGSSISKVENNSNSQNKEEEITLQDKITIDNFCEFNILSSSFSKNIEPTNPTGYYTYLEGKDETQKYFELTVNVKNLSTSAVKQDSLMSVKILYDNNYQYNCSLVTEKASGNELETFPNLYSIEPLKSLKYRFVVEVPKEIETDGKPLKAIITANGNTYIYKIR